MTGAEAIEKAQELGPDLILLDFSMPGMNGGETARILKKSMPQVPIILFTLDEASVNEALAAAMGVDRVLAKPGAALSYWTVCAVYWASGQNPRPLVTWADEQQAIAYERAALNCGLD